MKTRPLPSGKPIKAFHPILPHVSKSYPEQFQKEEILVPIFQAGRLVYPLPRLQDIQKKTLESLSHLRPEHKRLQNPHLYHVSLGEKLFQKKQELLKAAVE